MAEKYFFSCLFSFLRPSVGRPSSSKTVVESSSSPASPRTPICTKEGHNPALAEADVKGFAACAAQRFVTSFKYPVEKGKSSQEIDPAAFLIAQLDEGWFSDNVMRFAWRDVCNFPCSRSGPTTGELMLWASRNFTDSNDLGELSGIESPDPKVGFERPSPTLRKSIEMVQPLLGTGTGSIGDKDTRGLPGSRLRRFPKVPTEDTSLSDGEKGHYRRRQVGVNHLSGVSHRFGEARAEIGGKLKSVKRREARATYSGGSSSRRFSDGDEDKQEGIICGLARVKEEGEFQAADDYKSQAQGSQSLTKNRNFRCERRHGSRSVGSASSSSSDAERRKPNLVPATVQVPGPPLRKRGKGRLNSVKSLSDAEYDELRGCMDLGFSLNRDELTPRVISTFPALRPYKSGEELSGMLNRSPISRNKSHSPKGWTAYTDPPLLNWQISASTDSKVDADLKAHLKSWAHSVAQSVSAEC